MKNSLLSLTLFFLSFEVFSQVGINTTMPQAQLDIKSSNQVTPSNTDGILIPKIDTFPLTNPTAAQQGMMVYLTTISAGKQPGFYYWDNITVNWIGLGGGSASSGWSLTGNAGTNPATNFIGTTDATDVVFKRNNLISGILDEANTSFGNQSMLTNTPNAFNSAFGFSALRDNTTGMYNVAVGGQSLIANSTGSNNVGIGTDALNRNVSGDGNIAVGNTNLSFNISGSNNTAIGNEALTAATGTGNVGVGGSAGTTVNTGNNNVAIGYATDVPNGGSDNQLSIMNVIYGANMSTAASGKIGIGVPVPTEKLEIAGKTKTTNFQMTTGAALSNIFTSDAVGNASWQTPNAVLNGFAWKTTGNSGTNTATNFIGTTDAVPLNFRVNNENAGRIDLYNSVYLGYQVGSGVSNLGLSNTGIGAQALFSNTTGDENTAIGSGTLYNNTGGGGNTAIGFGSIKGGSGNYNTANGYGSLGSNAGGSSNNAFGTNALNRNTSGNNNVAIGSGALYENTTGSNATAIGYGAMQNANSTATAFDNKNVAVGYESLRGSITPANNTGNNNTALGYQTMINNITGDNNSGFGYRALNDNTSGGTNIAVGNYAMFGNKTGDANVAIGSVALYSCVAGSFGTAIGTNAMGFYNDTTVPFTNTNVAIGANALQGYGNPPSSNTGLRNSAIGFNALKDTGSGNENTAIGFNSLVFNFSGGSNTVIGNEAMTRNNSGNSNTAIGNQALFQNVTGSNNIAIGNQAAYNETGSNKLYIENSNSATPLIYGQFDTNLVRVNGLFKVNSLTTAGNEMQVKNSNVYVHSVDANLNFTTASATSDDFMVSSEDGGSDTGGIRGDGNNVTIWSPADDGRLIRFVDEDLWWDGNGNPYDNGAERAYIDAAGQYFQVSDQNKKENIKKLEDASNKIDKISGYTYQFKLSSEEIKKGDKPIVSSGVLAQEIEQVLPEAIQKNEKGEYFVDYAAITPLLIEAIKEQNTKIKSLEAINSEILKRLEKLENK